MYKVKRGNEIIYINSIENGKKYLVEGCEIRDDETNTLLTTEEDLEKYNPTKTYTMVIKGE
jgi:hypothetical protein